MEVLVVESDPGVAAVAIAELEAAGHAVRRCHDEGARVFPCAGLDPGRCPLTEDAIDVVLTVRGQSHPRPSPLEDGVTCALRQHVPVVVSGSRALNPFDRFPVTMAGADVVDACERAATGPQLGHEAVATRALEVTLERDGLPTDAARSSVHRSARGLRVTLFLPSEAPKRVRDMASVRVAGALRAFDAYAPRIEVTCEVAG